MNKQWSKNLRDLLARLFLKNPEERMKQIAGISKKLGLLFEIALI